MQKEHRHKKLFFLVLLSLVPASLVFSQFGIAGYTGFQKEVILYETFDGGSDKWPLPQGKWENGSLVISDRLNMQAPKTTAVIPIDETQDIEIELTASSTSGLLPGQFHWNNYWWEITAGASSSVYMNGSQIKYFGHKTEKNGFNKYSIRKSGSTLYYFIDEKNVGSTAYSKSQAPGKLIIGFSGKINIDNLKISYLRKEDPLLANNSNDDPTRTSNAADKPGEGKKGIQAGGKYYGLIIGVSKYNDPKLFLENPEKDATEVRKIFVNRYSFADSTTFLLLNPTRQKIISELYRLRKIIGPNDNLLIFYAGHGIWDKDAKQGYWWAKDASRDDPSSWLSNGDLREQIRGIKSAHTLLISDACFSGGIFRTRGGEDLLNASKDIQVLYKMPSRRAITSGTMTVVPDNSVFLEYFLKRLRENQAPFISSQQLFDSFRSAVINNSNVVPQDGVIAETGDEGGDFIFILKSK